MFQKQFDLNKEEYGSPARTLEPVEVLENHKDETGQYSRTHPDKWTISGVIVEDYFYWVNDFEASHPIYGRVWGNFEDIVYADSEEGFQNFVANHPAYEWDYEDI